MSRLNRCFPACLIVLGLFFSCTSAPRVVPEDLGVSELLQLGQNSLGSMDYDAALAYFQAVIDRYSSNTQALVNAQYEIAHTHYKQGNYEEAEAGFRALLARYEESNVLPQQFKVLSEIGLEKLKKN